MPVIKSAIRKLRRDRRREVINRRIRKGYKRAVKEVREEPTTENLALASSSLDRAAKRRVIHSNKASRMKSRLARLVLSS